MKKYLYLILFFLVCVPAIAGTINSYTLKSPPDNADTIVIYDSDDGSTKKIEVGDISGSGTGINWSSYSDLTSLSAANEFIVNSSGTSKSINWENLGRLTSEQTHSVFNVKYYGATGDGTTNDTTYIQAAIDAAHAAGSGTVYFPHGTYSTSDLTLYTDVSLLGESRDASIIKARTGTTNIIYYTNLASDTFAPFYTYIRDLEIDGNSVTSVVGLKLLNSPFLTVEDVRVHHCDIGFYLTGGYLSNITGSRFTSNRVGLYFAKATLPTTANLPNEITISHSSITANTEWGLKTSRISSMILTSIDVEQNGTSADLNTGGILMQELNGDSTSTGVGLIVKNAWFEANHGQADIQIESTSLSNAISLHVDSSVFDEYVVSGTRSQYYIYSPNSIGNVSVSNSYFEGSIDNYVVGNYKTINVAATTTNNAYRPEIYYSIGAQDGYLSEISSTKHMYLVNTAASSSTGGGAIALMATDQAALANGDRLGAINFVGSTTAAKTEFAARIQAFVDGTVGDGDFPTKLTFDTTADGSTTRTERMTIRQNGNVGIGTLNPTSLFQVGATNSTALRFDGTNLGIGTTAPGATLDLGTGNMRVGIGTTTAGTIVCVKSISGATSILGYCTGSLTNSICGTCN